MNKFQIAVKKFFEIRDLPYHISTKGEAGVCCEEKAQMLINQLHWLGINARVRIGFFEWSVLKLPAQVMKIKHDDSCSHCFVEVKNENGDWIFVDPTWNKELKKAGFEIAEWDGINPTSLAMQCHKILSAKESAIYMSEVDYEGDLEQNSEFYEAINKFCDSLLK